MNPTISDGEQRTTENLLVELVHFQVSGQIWYLPGMGQQNRLILKELITFSQQIGIYTGWNFIDAC